MNNNYKIRVKSPEHSRIIQEFFFSEGYEWADGGKIVLNEEHPSLFVRDGEVLWGNDTAIDRHLEFDLIKLIKDTKVSRTFYKNRILSESSGKLIVKV